MMSGKSRKGTLHESYTDYIGKMFTKYYII